MERTNWQTLQKKVYHTKHRLIRLDIRYRWNSMFKVATNIETGTVDYYGLWIRNYGLIWTINSDMIFFFFGGGGGGA